LRKTIPVVIALLFPLWGCKDEITVPLEPVVPQITSVQLPSEVYLVPAQTVGLHVRVDDPQGPADVAQVTLTFTPAGGSALPSVEMKDDGQAGDILGGDGQYYLPFNATLTNSQTGLFVVQAVARDKSDNQSEVAQDTVVVLAGSESRLPVVSSATAPAFLWIDSTYQELFLASAEDPEGAASIRHVLMEFYPSTLRTPSFVDSLRDDGLHEDGAANDGLFGGRISPASIGNKSGFYSLVFHGVDQSGGRGPALVKSLELTRKCRLYNRPPQVSDLQAPSNISRSASPNSYLLSIVASDPDIATCDDSFRRVFFKSFRPDGTPANDGNPFTMRDDGLLGDATAGDSRYSVTIQITPQNATGTYRFEFQAEDQNRVLSEKLIHYIVVVP